MLNRCCLDINSYCAVSVNPLLFWSWQGSALDASREDVRVCYDEICGVFHDANCDNCPFFTQLGVITVGSDDKLGIIQSLNPVGKKTFNEDREQPQRNDAVSFLFASFELISNQAIWVFASRGARKGFRNHFSCANRPPVPELPVSLPQLRE